MPTGSEMVPCLLGVHSFFGELGSVNFVTAGSYGDIHLATHNKR